MNRHPGWLLQPPPFNDTVQTPMDVNDRDHLLERLLRSPTLREPGADLDPRIDATLASFAVRRTRSIRLYRMAIAAGLIIAAGVGIRISLPGADPPVAQVTPRKPEPIHIECETSTLYDYGVLSGSDDSAYQKYRRRTVREIWLIDPATHAKVQMTIPSEQIVIEKLEAF